MGFPFLAPLKKWTTDKIEAREKNKEALNTLMPFVVLSSAAVVTKTITKEDLPGIYANQNFDAFDYKGCVIANSTDILKNYQQGKTLVGYDLDGKPIEVEGETNRRVSMPIIESVEIDTDGGNNTLKTASIKIRVFTLKQLEMFELFFLRPSMRIVLEYGWNVGIREKLSLDITTRMFAKQSHTDYIAKFSKIYSRADDGYKIAKGEYLKTLEGTDGNYDFMAGVVSSFSFQPAADGTYDVTLELSAGNELQLWMPVKQSKDSNKTPKKGDAPQESPYQTWVNKLTADLGNPTLKDLFFNNQKEWENEFFNWSAINVTQKDTSFSKDPYISMRLILKLVAEMRVYKESKEVIGYYYYEDTVGKKPIIPVTSSPIIISPTTDFILPGKLPFIGKSQDAKKKDIIILDPKGKKQDALIYGRQFNLSDEKTPFTVYDGLGNAIELPTSTGNLYNMYFNYNTFVSVYNRAYTGADIINGIFDTINANMFGLCKLELSKSDDGQDGGPLTIIDRKLNAKKPTIPNEKVFRFKIGALNSIVKEFSFNMELSTLMQAQALYASQLAIASAQKIVPADSKVPVKDPYAHADLSFAKNADKYYSVNAVEIQIVKDSNAWNKRIEETANVEQAPPPKKEGEEEVENVAEVLSKNFVRFKKNPTDSKSLTTNYIYTDAAIIQKHITLPQDKENTSALTYLDITLAIDGMAGLSCGEYFHIDGVPEIYNENGYFQITNVKQGIDANGWKTTIEAGYMINSKAKEEPKTNV
jgi:hypothetical protein